MRSLEEHVMLARTKVPIATRFVFFVRVDIRANLDARTPSGVHNFNRPD
jgi:hypothetical protein